MKTVNVDLLHLKTKMAAMQVFHFVKEKKKTGRFLTNCTNNAFLFFLSRHVE